MSRVYGRLAFLLFVASCAGREAKDFAYKPASSYSSYYPATEDASGNAWSASPLEDAKISWSSATYPEKYVVNSYPSSISENCASGLPAAMSELIHTGKFGVKAGLAAIIAALIAKLPVLLVIKALVFKLIVVPFAFLAFALPVLLPMLYMMLPGVMNMMGVGGTTTTPAPPPAAAAANRSSAGGRDSKTTPDLERVMRSLLGSHRCLERIACKLGARDADSSYKKPTAWLLKTLQSMVPSENTPLREKLQTYRQAYILGANSKEDICDQRLFPCDVPQLWVKQNRKTFKLV